MADVGEAVRLRVSSAQMKQTNIQCPIWGIGLEKLYIHGG